MTKNNKAISLEHSRVLTIDELEAVAGGSNAEARIQSTLSSMVSEVIKNFGAALQTAARG
jgi:hypothetical protein